MSLDVHIAELRGESVRANNAHLRREPPTFDAETGAPQGDTWERLYKPVVEGDAVVFALYRGMLTLAADVRLGDRFVGLRERVWNGRSCDLLENYGPRGYRPGQPHEAGRMVCDWLRMLGPDEADLIIFEQDVGPELAAACVAYIEANAERWAEQKGRETEQAEELMREIDREAERQARSDAVKLLARPKVERLTRQYERAFRQVLATVSAKEGSDD